MRTIDVSEAMGLAEIFNMAGAMGYAQVRLHVHKRGVKVQARATEDAPWVQVGRVWTHKDLSWD